MNAVAPDPDDGMPTVVPESSRWRSRFHSSPVLLVLVSILSVQVGASFAKDLFTHLAPYTVTWLRLMTGAGVLLLVARPILKGRSLGDWGWAVAYGLVLTAMNLTMYLAFARIPIGTAVTLEFLGPLGVSVALSRRWRDLIWVVLPGLGVAMLGLAPGQLDPVGVALALVAGACWGGYILLAGPVGCRWDGLSGVTVGLTVGAVASTLVVAAAGAWPPPVPAVWAQGLAVGLLSSAVPFGLEMMALRHIEPRVFGILMSIEPAVAAGAAFVILGEQLSLVEVAAMVCVIVASVGAVRTSR